MALTLSAAMRNALAVSVQTILDSGAGFAFIKLYSGTKPATPDTAISTQTLLAELQCADPVGSVSGAVLTFGTITDDSSANATGTCTWARIFNGAGDAVFDASVTQTGGGGDITLNTTSLVAGGPVRITSFTITMPA